MENIREKVYNFKTKNKEGFVKSEIEKALHCGIENLHSWEWD